MLPAEDEAPQEPPAPPEPPAKKGLLDRLLGR
jgi:hypothetical protein